MSVKSQGMSRAERARLTALEAAIAALIPRVQTSAARTLNTVFRLSATRDVLVSYSVEIAASLTLSGGQTGTVILEIASNMAFDANVQEIARSVNGNNGTLTVGLTTTQTQAQSLNGFVPAGYYTRLRSVAVGTPTFTYRSGQEVLL